MALISRFEKKDKNQKSKMVKMKVLAWSDTGILGKEKLWAAHEGRINANECPLNSSYPLSCCNCSSCFKVDVNTCTEVIRWGSSEKVDSEAFCTRRWWKTEKFDIHPFEAITLLKN